MFRTVHPQLISLITKCQLQQCTMKMLMQSTRTLNVAPVILPLNIEKTPNVKAIIEVAESCGIPSNSIESVLDTNPHLLKYNPKRWSYVLKILFDYGFIVEDVLNMVAECPEILQMKDEKLSDILMTWQGCNFGEKLLLSLLSSHPKLLTAEKIDIIKRITMLTQYFEGRRRVGKAIGTAPSIFYENWDIIFEKLDYLNKLHIDSSEIASTGVLRFDLEHIKIRHEFLLRAGLYKMPTKNYKKSLDRNIKLHSIVNTSDQVFSSNVAGLTLLEYEVFNDLYSVEKQNDEDDNSDTDSDVE